MNTNIFQSELSHCIPISITELELYYLMENNGIQASIQVTCMSIYCYSSEAACVMTYQHFSNNHHHPSMVCEYIVLLSVICNLGTPFIITLCILMPMSCRLITSCVQGCSSSMKVSPVVVVICVCGVVCRPKYMDVTAMYPDCQPVSAFPPWCIVACHTIVLSCRGSFPRLPSSLASAAATSAACFTELLPLPSSFIYMFI